MRGTNNAALASSLNTLSATVGINFANIMGTGFQKDIDSLVNIRTDTNELQTNQGAWATATGFSTHSAANVRTEMDANSTVLADLKDGGRLDLLIDAIKVITDAIGAEAAANLAKTLSNAGVVSFTAETGTLLTTQATTNLTEATDDHYIGGVIIWLTGVLAGQRTDITDYAGDNGLLTYTACTEAPSDGDTGIIV
jgi:hypothetical protein